MVKIYLDASVIVSFLAGKDEHVAELFLLCNEKNILYQISPFSLMEALDIKQEHRYFLKKVADGFSIRDALKDRRSRNLTKEEIIKVHKDTLITLKPQKLDWYYYSKGSNWWEEAINIVSDTNINSSDAIHLAQALISGYDFLVTHDGPFIKEGNKYIKENFKNVKLEILRPNQMVEKLKGESLK